MSTLDKYLKRPKNQTSIPHGKYELYNLSENPFPSSPFVNPNSTDARTNGEIYEPSIREKEYLHLKKNFFEIPQSDPSHLRLGYIEDTSYTGRGNGKSAFILNMKKRINTDFGLSESNEFNKVFALTMTPEPSGKTKTFERFVDLLAASIFRSQIINDSLVSLRLEAIQSLYIDFPFTKTFKNEEDLVQKIKSLNWYKENNLDIRQINDFMVNNKFLQNLPPEFPLYSSSQSLFSPIIEEKDFIVYYENLKRGKPKYEFIFSHLIDLFLAAGFNGAYIFVDDFERIPDFQSERQKRDFAVELRSCLFDGLYTNARVGFYVFLLVLHAGIPRLIQDAWDQSGLGNRVPISYNKEDAPKHIVRFEKITLEHASILLGKYLREYRIKPTKDNDLSPFTNDAVKKIAEINEFNASKILKMSFELLEKAASKKIDLIDASIVTNDEIEEINEVKYQKNRGINVAPTKHLYQIAEK